MELNLNTPFSSLTKLDLFDDDHGIFKKRNCMWCSSNPMIKQNYVYFIDLRKEYFTVIYFNLCYSKECYFLKETLKNVFLKEDFKEC